MSWSSLFRASRFFAAAGVVSLALGLIPAFRGKPWGSIDVFLLHERYIVLSTPLLFVFVGSVLLIFGGVYGLFEQYHARRVNLILGQIHFWLTAVPLGVLFRVLYRFAQPAGAGDVNLQAIVQAEMKILVWSWLLLLLAQFVFLANLAIAFFRRAAGAQ